MYLDHLVIYSASIGSVVFELKIQEKQVRAVEFSNILNISDLRSNFLSCLYLSYSKEFKIIFLYIVMFERDSNTLFTASINSAILNDTIVTS